MKKKIKKLIILLMCTAILSENATAAVYATGSDSPEGVSAVALSESEPENAGDEGSSDENMTEVSDTESEEESTVSETEEETGSDAESSEELTEPEESTGEEELASVTDEETEEETVTETVTELTEEADEDKDALAAAEAEALMKEFMDERIKALNEIIDERVVMALLYLEDTYPLREGPSEDSAVIRDIEIGSTLYLKSAAYKKDKLWLYVSADSADGMTDGYIPYDKCICVDERFLAWEESLKEAPAADGGEVALLGGTDPIPAKARESLYTFPDRYRDELLGILENHPNWVFVPQNVGTSLDAAVTAEYEDPNRNWVYRTVDDSYKGQQVDTNWYLANKTGLRHYMDPENFIGSETNIFMFEQLTYNSSYHSEDGVQSVLNGTFMSGALGGDETMTYSHAIYEIGSELGISPYHLAARVYQEQNPGTSPLISGTYPGFEGYYNYFNIEASDPGNDKTQIYINGLTHAKEQGWDSRYKSIEGGAAFDAKKYILAGQDTPYLEKYNIVKKVYWHQYMQNASAPVSEASTAYKMYKNSGALNNAFVFKIPVFTGSGEEITWAPEDAEKLDKLGEGTPKIKAVTNITAKLGQVSLEKLSVPDDLGITSVKWKSPDKVLKGKAGESIQYFTVQFSRAAGIPYEVDIPVYVTTLNGFTIKDITSETEGIDYLKPDDVIQGSRRTIYEVTSNLTGYDPGYLLNVGLFTDFSISGKLKDGTQPVGTRTLSSENGRWVIELKVPDAEVPNLTDKSVGQLKFTASYVSMADAKKYASSSRTVTMTVLDTEPVLTPSKVTLNIWKRTGVPISLTAQNGNDIKDVKLLYNGEVSDILEAKKNDNGEWTVQFINYDAVKAYQDKNKGFTQNLKMEIMTNDNTVEKPFTVQAVATKPKVTLTTIKKPNLFYTDYAFSGYGEYAINSTEKVNVGYLSQVYDDGFNKAAAAGRPVFRLGSQQNPTGQYLSFNVVHDGVTPQNYKKIYNKMLIRISFEDYYPIVYPFTISYTFSKPTVKATAGAVYEAGGPGYIGSKQNVAEIKLDKELDDLVSISSSRLLTVTIDDPHITDFEWGFGGSTHYDSKRYDLLYLQTDEEFRSGKKKITFTHADLSSPITVTVNIQKKPAPELKLYESTISLNTNLVWSKDMSYGDSAYFAGNSDHPDIEAIVPANAAAAKLVEEGHEYLKMNIQTSGFWLWPDSENRGNIKAGTYKFDVMVKPYHGVEIKPARLTIKIVDKDPANSVKFKTQYSINLVNRHNTYVMITPTIKDLGYKTFREYNSTYVKVVGDYTDLFEVKPYRKGARLPNGKIITSESGVILVYAKDGAVIDSGKNYKLTISMTLENRKVILKTVTIKPKQTPAKTTGSVTKTTVPLNGDAVYFTIRSSGKTADDSIIESVELIADKNGTFFTYTPAASAGTTGTYIGTLKVNNTIKKTGSYKLTFYVRYKGHAGNVAAKKVYLTVKVK